MAIVDILNQRLKYILKKVKTPSFYYDLGGRYINWKFVFAKRNYKERMLQNEGL